MENYVYIPVGSNRSGDIIPQVTLRDLLLILWRRKWSIMTIVTVTILCAVGYLWFIRDDVYAVGARILVKLGREQAPPTTVVGASPLVVGYRTTEVNSEIEIFQSAQLIAGVVDRLGLDKPGQPAPVPRGLMARAKFEVKAVMKRVTDWKDEMLITLGLRERLSQRERVIAQLQQSLTVKAAKDSNVFVTNLGVPFRRGGSIVLNALIDDYLTFRRTLYQTQEADFFGGETSRASVELQRVEGELQEFEKNFNIRSFDKQKDLLLDQIARAEAAQKDQEIYLQDVSDKVRRLEAELRKPDPNFGAVGDFSRESLQHNLLTQLSDLEREREKLRLTELDTGDKIQNNRQQAKVLQEILAANLRSVLSGLQRTHSLQSQTIAKFRAELEGLHAQQMKWTDLKRGVTDLESRYLFNRKKLEEAASFASMDRRNLGNVVVIERPTDPLQPIGMRKTTMLGIALGIALFAALAWVALAEYFDHRVYSAQELERLVQVPVFAAIPPMRPRALYRPVPRALTSLGLNGNDDES